MRLAQSNAMPRMVEEVLALWIWEAAGGSPTDARSVFSERPTLERLLFSEDLRASLRGAPPMASVVFCRAMMSMLDYIRAAEPGDAAAEDRDALDACLAAEQRAHEARELAAAAAAAMGDAAIGRLHLQAARASREAEQAYKEAACLIEDARAARGCGDMGAPPGAGNINMCCQVIWAVSSHVIGLCVVCKILRVLKGLLSRYIIGADKKWRGAQRAAGMSLRGLLERWRASQVAWRVVGQRVNFWTWSRFSSWAPTSPAAATSAPACPAALVAFAPVKLERMQGLPDMG